MSGTGELPNLEVLKLIYYTFLGERWNMERGRRTVLEIEVSEIGFLGLCLVDSFQVSVSHPSEIP